MEQRPSGSGDRDKVEAPLHLYRVAWIFYLVLATVAVIWIGIREGGISTALLWSDDLTDPAAIGRSLGIDIGLGLASAVAIVGAWELGERLSKAAATVGEQLRTMLSGLTKSEAIGLALLSGLSEELFFRGAVQGSWNGWVGWAGATGLFAILHSGPGRHFRWWTFFAALAGGLMGFWFLFRGTLVAPIIAHMTVNGFQLVRTARLASSGSGPGRETSPENSDEA